ncbi:hypothetical protein IPL85_05475 [Candidatus Saccharibacteria bacterium]|nr:MAG: hypothetical protein IPL85_05475 [Candidatus Saccharibacteria bacterium]
MYRPEKPLIAASLLILAAACNANAAVNPGPSPDASSAHAAVNPGPSPDASSAHAAVNPGPSPDASSGPVVARFNSKEQIILSVADSQGTMSEAAIAACRSGKLAIVLSGADVELDPSVVDEYALLANVDTGKICDGDRIHPSSLPAVATIAGQSVIANLFLTSGRPPAGTIVP